MFELTRIVQSEEGWLEIFFREMKVVQDHLNHLTIGSARLETGIISVVSNLEADPHDSLVLTMVQVKTFIEVRRGTFPMPDLFCPTRIYSFQKDAGSDYAARQNGADVTSRFDTPWNAALNLIAHLDDGLKLLEKQLSDKQAEFASLHRSLAASAKQ